MSVIAELFEKISHPTRLKILALLQDQALNFSQLKNALNIESNGNLDHHLKKLDTLIYLDQGGLYKLSDDGKEALRAVQVMEATITTKKDPSVSAQSNRVFYALVAITCVFPLSLAAALIVSSFGSTSPSVLSLAVTGVIAAFWGLLVAVLGFKRTIKADAASMEPLTYFPSSKAPWSRGDWLRNVGFFGSYISALFALVYLQFSPIAFPEKTVWIVLNLAVLGVLGYTAQTLIYGILAKANRRLRNAQTTGAKLPKQK
jgi:DNA-binding transcriptional ArsR family regulator